MDVLRLNLQQCAKCPDRAADCAGKCECRVDGRDVYDHATAGDCPKKRFTIAGPATGGATAGPRKPDIPLPGDIIEKLAAIVGADRLAKWWDQMTGVPCGCAERKEKINAAMRRLVKWCRRLEIDLPFTVGGE